MTGSGSRVFNWRSRPAAAPSGVLVRSEREVDGAERIFGDVHLSASRELLRRVLAGEVGTVAMRLYSGYAGWAPGQLESELEAGGWRVLPGDSDLVFADDPDAVWDELMRRSEVQWARRAVAGVGRAP